MIKPRMWGLGFTALLLAASPAACADPPARGQGAAPPAVRDAQALAARIDELVAQR